MAKVLFPDRIVRALHELHDRGYTNGAIIKEIVQRTPGFEPLTTYFQEVEKLDVLIDAFAKGFEAERTPPQRIFDLYKDSKKEAESMDYDRKYIGQAKAETIEYVLEQLEIQITGINL